MVEEKPEYYRKLEISRFVPYQNEPEHPLYGARPVYGYSDTIVYVAGWLMPTKENPNERGV